MYVCFFTFFRFFSLGDAISATSSLFFTTTHQFAMSKATGFTALGCIVLLRFPTLIQHSC